MTSRGLVVLCVLGVVSLAGGWYFGTAHEPAEQSSVAGGTLMFPGLTARLGDAARIEITHQNKTIALVRQGDKAESPWGLAQRDMYPVQASKLREMLTALTELRLVEPRTTDPALFGKLGLADANDAQSTSDLLRVFDSKAKPIAELLVGHRRVRTAGNVPDEVYVRRPGQMQTWLAEGSLQVDADPQQWLDRDIMNIDHARIASVVVHHGAAELDFAAKDGKLVLTAPQNPPKLEEYKLDEVGRGLELLSFEDVVADKDAGGAKLGASVGEAVFTTSDGLAVHVTVLKGDKDVWARFSAEGSDKVKDEAAKLNAKVSGWTFQLGAWKQAALVPDLDTLKATPPAPAPGSPAPSSPAPGAAPPAAATGAPAAPNQ